MEGPHLVEKAHEFTDLELAILLSLVAEQHCIIDTHEEAIDSLGHELAFISSKSFNLSHSTIECSASTRLDDFREAILVDGTSSEPPGNDEYPGRESQPVDIPSSSRPSRSSNVLENERKIVNVIIAKRLHLARHEIQIQALELIRTKRIFTHTDFHITPKRFLFVALLSDDGSGNRLTSHLVDHIFLSHYHSPDGGFHNLEEVEDELFDGSDDDDSTSVVRKSISTNKRLPREKLSFSTEEVSELTRQSQAVTLGVEVNRYLHNIIVFLRLHRAVAGGISPRATKHFEQLAKCLAPLHGLSYVTPSLVALAAKKVYPHRIVLTTPEDERSMQWGSDIHVVAAMLRDFDADTIIDDVLDSVEVPT